jgi:D-serine deaminase-like pyridoxal phosphate-dependent protein
MSDFALPPQSFTPYSLERTASKDVILEAFKGKPVSSIRTPALFIDRAIFSSNCAKMQNTVKTWGTRFRVHVKSHKVSRSRTQFDFSTHDSNSQTVEGARLQLKSTAGQSSAVIVSTLMEARQIIESDLVKEGVVDDVSDSRYRCPSCSSYRNL